jgi:hypothetical protein
MIIGLVIHIVITAGESVYNSQYCIFFGSVSLCRITEFFIAVRPAMSKMMRTYYDNKLVLESGDQNEI